MGFCRAKILLDGTSRKAPCSLWAKDASKSGLWSASLYAHSENLCEVILGVRVDVSADANAGVDFPIGQQGWTSTGVARLLSGTHRSVRAHCDPGAARA